MQGFSLFFLFVWGSTCAPKEEKGLSTEGKTDSFSGKVYLSDLKIVIPSPELPPEVTPQVSNNNLDVTIHQGRIFLAFRTAPSHFASSHTTLYVISSTNGTLWEWEGSFSFGRDLREPRFLSFQNELYLYFATLGKNPFAFEPGEMMVTRYISKGDWSTPEKVFHPGFIPWRIKNVSGKVFLFGYEGGENIYNFSGKPIRVYFLTLQENGEWVPVDRSRPVLLEGGCSETDGEWDKKGDLYLVCRNEAGDQEGFGSRICVAKGGDLSQLRCVMDRKKYDSPLLFSVEDEIFLLGRRNISPTGEYDLFRDFSFFHRLLFNQLDYWSRPKRCSLFHLEKNSLHLTFLVDLPSRGDTCFPSIIRHGEREMWVYNYTSDLDGPDLSWREGQLRPTYIYRVYLAFDL